ncbi:MAG: class I SAM-dependent methyltransferase [Bradymonadales bacterium]|nr:class I SAM-dependent methyltransferase [Bradymonadales bacterium]
MKPETYGDTIADIYDELTSDISPDAIELLADLAGPAGRALELGIGTGRVALPLAAKGVSVHGIDASRAMVEKLHGKPGGDRIPVTVGNFAEVGSVQGGPFELAFCVFNTFFALLTQEDQLACFQGVASVLTAGGACVLEAFVPDHGRFDHPQPVLVSDLYDDDLQLEASHHEPIAQRVSSRLIRIREGKLRVYPVELRYAWPSELDLMARLAGMHLEHRWAGWDRSPFGKGSTTHISVYRRSAG